MINYNPKEWTKFIFLIHKADTFRQLFPMMVYIGVYAGIIAYIELSFFNLSSDHYIKNVSLIHTLLGFALSMLLVFRTNSAYDRWWEGRKLWGSLVNSSRNLSLKLNAILESETDKKFFAAMIPNFAYAMKNHLRGKYSADEIESTNDFDVASVSEKKHVPNQISKAIFLKLNQLRKDKRVTDEQLLQINSEVQNFSDVVGACERIKNTPIPFSYSVFLKKFIFFYVMTLPMGYVLSLRLLIIPVSVFIFYALASLELIAEEIENPFGTDANDLPAEQICEVIKKSANEIFDLN